MSVYTAGEVSVESPLAKVISEAAVKSELSRQRAPGHFLRLDLLRLFPDQKDSSVSKIKIKSLAKCQNRVEHLCQQISLPRESSPQTETLVVSRSQKMWGPGVLLQLRPPSGGGQDGVWSRVQV